MNPEETSEVQSFHFPDFGDDGDTTSPIAGSAALPHRSCLRVEYGRMEVPREAIADWRDGVTFTLPQGHAELVTVRVDGKAVARGELVEVEGKLAVRVVELVSITAPSHSNRKSA